MRSYERASPVVLDDWFRIRSRQCQLTSVAAIAFVSFVNCDVVWVYVIQDTWSPLRSAPHRPASPPRRLVEHYHYHPTEQQANILRRWSPWLRLSSTPTVDATIYPPIHRERERERESGEWEGVGVSNFGEPSLLEAARCGLPFSDYVIEKCREPVVRRTLFVAAAAADADRVKADLAACVCQRWRRL